jgi:hypothetical protein
LISYLLELLGTKFSLLQAAGGKIKKGPAKGLFLWPGPAAFYGDDRLWTARHPLIWQRY